MLELLAQKAINANSPINVRAFLREFKEATGATEHIHHLEKRFKFIKSKIHESADFDEKTKLGMLFVSGASVPHHFLQILRKNALVEVDERNRIIKWKANDGSVELTGDYSHSARTKAGWAEKRKKDEARKSSDYFSKVELKNESIDDSSKEFVADLDNNCPDGTGNNIYPDDLEYEIPVRRRSMKTEDDIDYDSPTEKSPILSNEPEKRESRTYNRNINMKTDEDEAQQTETVTTRSGRVSKKRVSKANFFQDPNGDSETFLSTKSKKSFFAASTSINPESTEKKRKTGTEGSSSSKRAKPDLDNSMRPNNLDDYDSNYSFHRVYETKTWPEAGIRENEEAGELDQRRNKSPTAPTSSKTKRKADTERFSTSKLSKLSSDGYVPNQSIEDSSRVELKPFRGSILDNYHLNPLDEGFKMLERPPIPQLEVREVIEAPIKTEIPTTPEQEKVPMKIDNPVEDVKPKFTSQLKLLEAMKSLIVTLDNTSLSNMKSKICRMIWKIGKLDKGISNDEMIPAMELLIARMNNHSVTSFSETVESVNLKEFLCYLKATICNLKLEGVDALLKKIKGIIKEPTSKDKSIPVEKVESVLQTTLDVIGF